MYPVSDNLVGRRAAVAHGRFDDPPRFNPPRLRHGAREPGTGTVLAASPAARFQPRLTRIGGAASAHLPQVQGGDLM